MSKEKSKGKGLDLGEIEEKWQQEWKKSGIYKFDFESDRPLFSIDTPPPTVSGGMHLGHAFAYVQQDFIARYKKMRGYNVFHPFGFDDNGLATERFVGAAKGIRAADFERDEYIKICLETTKEAEQEMQNDWSRLGMSVDWSLLYRTIDTLSRKTAQRSFLDIYEKGRLYRTLAPVMWCPKCETTIAQAELEDKEFDSSFNDVLFELEGGEKITIATTRPELLPACVAIFINPEDKKHKNLAGQEAKVPLFNHKVPILEDRRVDPEKGTGIVMCCTFGDQTDMEWYKAYKLPLKIVITKDGKMAEEAAPYSGMKMKAARKKILEDLEKAGLLGDRKPITHAVNVHERCKTEIEFIVAKVWYLKYLDLKDEFIAQADKVNWHPAHMKSRLDNWVQGLQWDWCLSRQRHYGVPIPVWYCKKCEKVMLPSDSELPVDPLKDKPKQKCICSSDEFVPEKDVFDTWFISSLTPQINAKWREDDKFFRKIYPMDLRPQGHDIISLWAFNTIVKGILHHSQLPWRDIMINGWALDPKGKKMSKSLGNTIDPKEMIKKYSADVLRYWAASASLGEDVPFQEKEMVSGNKFLVKLFNAARFVATLTEDFDFGKTDEKDLKFRATDKWILSRVNSLCRGVTAEMDKYEFSKGLGPVRDFFWLEFADFYIEEVKYRLYGKNTESKKAAQFTLLYVLSNCMKMLAPFIPHITEEIMQSVFKKHLGGKSLHLEKWPEADEGKISEYYELLGLKMNEIISALRKYKTEGRMALNAELGEVTIFLEGRELEKKINEAAPEIKETAKAKVLNVVVGSAPENAVPVGRGISFSVEKS